VFDRNNNNSKTERLALSRQVWNVAAAAVDRWNRSAMKQQLDHDDLKRVQQELQAGQRHE
jgi:hypothetical protein